MMLYAPSELVVVSLVRLVSVLTIVTVAPGTNAPCASLTTPTTLPYRIWADAGTAETAMAMNEMAMAKHLTTDQTPDRDGRTVSATNPSSVLQLGSVRSYKYVLLQRGEPRTPEKACQGLCNGFQP